MAYTRSLSQDLLTLAEALSDPEVVLEAMLRELVESVRVTVSSCTGLRWVFHIGGEAVVLDTLTDPTARTAVRTSLRVPLPTDGAVTASGLTLWAQTPGAFVDLAADLATALHLPLSALVLDDDLPAATVPPGSGLGALSLVHQAVGVLIARGHHPDQAHADLERRATTAGTTTAVAARQVINSVTPAARPATAGPP